MTGIVTLKIWPVRNDKVYRRVEIGEAASLFELAVAINRAFEFDFDHAFGFYDDLDDPFSRKGRRFELFSDMEVGDEGVAGVERTLISEALQQQGAKMLYLFDYGDEWRFLVELEGRKDREKGKRYPRIVEKCGKAPIQYPEPD